MISFMYALHTDDSHFLPLSLPSFFMSVHFVLLLKNLTRAICMTMGLEPSVSLGCSAEVVHLKTMIPPLPESTNKQ